MDLQGEGSSALNELWNRVGLGRLETAGQAAHAEVVVESTAVEVKEVADRLRPVVCDGTGWMDAPDRGGLEHCPGCAACQANGGRR
jgi:hypothetical protein